MIPFIRVTPDTYDAANDFLVDMYGARRMCGRYVEARYLVVRYGSIKWGSRIIEVLNDKDYTEILMENVD